MIQSKAINQSNLLKLDLYYLHFDCIYLYFDGRFLVEFRCQFHQYKNFNGSFEYCWIFHFFNPIFNLWYCLKFPVYLQLIFWKLFFLLSYILIEFFIWIWTNEVLWFRNFEFWNQKYFLSYLNNYFCNS